ncbi:MAG: hypothetical protein CMK09_10880 [Ponticaulis sp.]|nr:hypothetical protein [Ponticaulis sp.]|tara:strand:+ start:3749 stop:4549 length:801 start_codon:yes stop_codon:yes gene_type:complete
MKQRLKEGLITFVTSSLALFGAGAAQADEVSLARCAALYDHYDGYVLEGEFSKSPVLLPVDYEIRAIAARTLAEQLGEPQEWDDPEPFPEAGPVEFYFKSVDITKCDNRLGLVPDTHGPGTSGRKDGYSFTRPDNLACAGTLITATLGLDPEKEKTVVEKVEGHLASIFHSLALVGWTAEDANVLAAAVFDEWIERLNTGFAETNGDKLSGQNELNDFTQQCMSGYPVSQVDLFSVEQGSRETYCIAQRQLGRQCDDALTLALESE